MPSRHLHNERYPRPVRPTGGFEPSGRPAYGAVFLATLLVTCLFAPSASGCPYSIRDVAFIELDSVPYRFYFFVKNDTPNKDSITQVFKQASEVILTDSNVEAEIVNLDEQATHPSTEYLRFWEVKSFPAAILVSPGGRSMVLPILDPRKSPEEAIWSSLEKVVSSPRREELAENIVRAWSVILLVAGKESGANQKAKKAVADAINDINRIINQSGGTAEEGPYLIVLSAQSSAEEEILLWSTGMEDRELSGPRAAVLYGMGRQIGPVLEGENLTSDSLLHVLRVIGMKCACDTNLMWLSGTQIPLKWGKELRAKVVKYLGFDPDSPLVKAEVAGVWSAGSDFSDDGRGVFAYTEGEIADRIGYVSLTDEPAREKDGASASLDIGSGTSREAAAPGKSTLGKRMGKVTLIVGLGLTLVLLIASVLIIIRTKESRTAS